MERPLPLFDSVDHIHRDVTHISQEHRSDFEKSREFLRSYSGSQGTFNSYRREIERLLHWSWKIQHKTVNQLKRGDIEAFIAFCQKPPLAWIGTKKSPRFIEKEGQRLPNSEWHPFIVTVKKMATMKGITPSKKDYELSPGALKETFAILSTYFNFLIQEEHIALNPVALIRQKSKFVRKQQGPAKIRRLSDTQWQYVLETAHQDAEKDPLYGERNLFILTLLYALYLRISEICANPRWTPTMNDFFQDQTGDWWFCTVGKGNKERHIAVSDAVILSLKRYRKHLNLTPLPSPADESPLFPKMKGKGPLKNTSYVRKVVQERFDKATQKLLQDGHKQEAEHLMEATVHWLRHTGISDDVKHRPREHVRDDAGHSSSAITDRYIDIERTARHRSARKKPLLND